MEYAGYPAAAALGFIGGNIPGAVGATELYHKYRMWTPPNKRRRGSNPGTGSSGSTWVRTPTPRGRVRKLVSIDVPRRVVGSARTGANSDRTIALASALASGNRVLARRSKKKGVSKRRKTRPAKLKKPVKLAISKMIHGQDVRGTYRKVVSGYNWYGGTPSYGASFENKQKVEYLPVSDAFSPTQIMDAAAILWNNKSAEASSTPTTASAFPLETTKVFVRSCYMSTTFKNNSKRTYYYKIYNCAPRNCDVGLDPRGDWDVNMTNNEKADLPDSSGPNVFSVNLEQLGRTPTDLPGFNKNWKYEVTKFVLQPGQTYVYAVQGPKDQMYDFSKFYQGATYQPLQKMNRYQMVVYHGDMLGSSTGKVGYWPEVGDTTSTVFDGKGVLIEQVFGFNLAMPEQVGFVYPTTITAGNMQVNRFRRYAYANTTYVDSKTGNAVRIDDEDPANAYDPT